MLLFHLTILALVQGITEFLPVSSSGHLVLVHNILNDNLTLEQDRILDVSVHIGTLFSVLLYFRKDVGAMLAGLIHFLMRPSFKSATDDAGSRQLTYLIIGTIPVMVVGLIMELTDPCWVGSVEVVAWGLIVFGIILWAADRFSPRTQSVKDMTMKDAIFVGLAQTLALIPGVSRAGITMTAARLRGYERAEAARFSLLMAMIAISAAGILSAVNVIRGGDYSLLGEAGFAALIAFVAGYVIISLMMKWLQSYSYTPFVIYRILLGVFLLTALYNPVATTDMLQAISGGSWTGFVQGLGLSACAAP